MRKHRTLAVAVCASLLAVMGCKGKTVTLVTAGGNPVQEAEDGQVLEWRILPSSVNVISFEVQFIGTNPCGANQGPIVGYPNKPAHCTVSAGSQTGGYVFYKYSVLVTESDSVRGDHPTRVVPCTACGLVAGGGGSTTDNGSQVARSSPSTANPGSESLAPPNVSVNPVVVLDCVDQRVTVNPSGGDSSIVQWYSGGSIQPDWSVTFVASSPCAEQQPFNKTNNACTVSAATPGTYNYTVTAGKCSSTPGQGTVTVTAP
jgi:hypothetical protein